MKFGKSRNSGYLFDTEVENIFISEYMAPAPGEYVKVYLYALMCAESGEAISEEKLAKLLMLDPAVVEKALFYWQDREALKIKETPEGRRIVFTSLREMLFGSGNAGMRGAGSAGQIGAAAEGSEGGESNRAGQKTAGAGDAELYDKNIADMLSSIEQVIGRPLGGKEPLEICSWMDDFGATPETIATAYSYSVKTYGKDNAAYVGKIVKDWAYRGLDDVVKIDSYLEELGQNRMLYKRVFKALGFMRNPTEEEKKIMDAWFSEMHFSIDHRWPPYFRAGPERGAYLPD